ncbi:hypothetical protein ABN072_01750 [Providencia rettgeri]|uniref:hypothetical protein n=1 Tax=Providencia rettgeri TaxID=587 RepID=UPI0032DAFC26
MLLLVTKGCSIKNRLKLAGTLLANAWKILFSNQLTVMITAKDDKERVELVQLAKAVTLSS